jgi:hypothetical protein
MLAQGLDPFAFRRPFRTVLNLALIDQSVAFVGTRAAERLGSLVRAMCGTVDEAVLPSTSIVITDSRSSAEKYSAPLVHSTWVEALMKNPAQSYLPYVLSLRPAAALSQPKRPAPRFGPVRPLKLAEAGKRPSRAIDASLSQARIQTAFLASPVRPLPLEVPRPQCTVAADVESRPVTPETPKVLSPTLMRLCTALMLSPTKATEQRVPSSPRSIEELSCFTQAIDDDEEELEFDIAYGQTAEGGPAARSSQERDPLLDLFRASQTFSQTPRDEWA